jgi:hypothetical protein
VEGKGIIQSSGASIELQKRPVHVLKSRGDLVRKSFENMEQKQKDVRRAEDTAEWL